MPDPAIPPSASDRPIAQVAIVGRGIIGSSWAQLFARAGLRVRIWDRGGNPAAALAQVEALVASLAGTNLAGDAGTLDRITVHPSLAETVAGVDYIQESIAESIEAKRAVFREIEGHTRRDAIIGSSTSGLLPSAMAESFAMPGRFLVVHPLTPPHLLPVTEICPSPKTEPAVVETVIRFMRAIGQEPILLRKEIPGFALNRILGATLNELFALIRDGVLDPGDVDAALTEGFGLRWSVIGPFAAMDLNAPGGVRDYLGRYGGIFAAAAQSRGMASALSPEVIDAIASALGKRFADADPDERKARRDRAIAEMRSYRDTIRRP